MSENQVLEQKQGDCLALSYKYTPSAMPEDPRVLLNGWLERDRPLLIIDETRRSTGSDLGQYVLFAAVQMTTKTAHKYMKEVTKIRENFPSRQTAEKVFKGSDLFGNDTSESHAPMQRLVREQLDEALDIAYILTYDKDIMDYANSSIGGLGTIAGPGVTNWTGRVWGPELIPVLNFIKKIAIDLNFGDQQVDVLIDRSSKLGFIPKGLDRKDRSTFEHRFHTFGPLTLNQLPDGSMSEPFCPSSFFLIAPSEKGDFRDLLMLPDSAAYLCLHKGGIEQVKINTDAGEAIPRLMWYRGTDKKAL